MYGYHWIGKGNLYELSVTEPVQKELRPVFEEEIKLLGLDKKFSFVSGSRMPLLWAEGVRRYIHNGTCVAEAAGGSFYEMPKVEFLSESLIELKPVDIDKLWEINESLMNGLVQRSISFIRKIYDEYSDKGYKFIVAFSGGKDSLVLLDLVQRALSPDQFVVIFGDTGMELSDTYATVDAVRFRYPNLNFQIAKSILKASESWHEFGPPGRRLRWCCAIHKSVPTLLLLKKMSGGRNVRAVVFDGVRHEESEKRATYKETAEGQKHVNQVNARPILEWNAAELYLYLLKRDILFNKAYRFGMSRVGCAVCPMSAGWRDAIASVKYQDDIKPFLSVVEEFAERNKGASEVKSYVSKVKWGARMGGIGLKDNSVRVYEKIKDKSITFSIVEPLQDWIDVAAILGPIVERKGNVLEQNIRGLLYRLEITNTDVGVDVNYTAPDRIMSDRFAVSWMRGVANKVAYCIGCQTCMCECPTGAFDIDENKKIHILQQKCVHCAKCITEINKGCWRAFSLHLPQKGNNMYKGMDRYKGFGLRQEFLEHFFDLKEACWSAKQLGNLQYESLRGWLRDAGLIDSESKSGAPTELAELLFELSAWNPLTWAIIWTNLAHTSPLVRWYLFEIPAGEGLDRNDLLSFVADEDCPAERTKSNVIVTITDTMNSSPLGSGLEMGIPIGSGKNKKYIKQGWSTPDPWATLYSLYLYAEKIGNHYDFTLRELLTIGREKKTDLPAVDPITIFALNPDNVKELFRELSAQFPQYIKTSFVAGLDNIQLVPTIKSIDIVKAAVKEA